MVVHCLKNEEFERGLMVVLVIRTLVKLLPLLGLIDVFSGSSVAEIETCSRDVRRVLNDANDGGIHIPLIHGHPSVLVPNPPWFR
jgi:hypothetical protein